jgi:nucleoid-associated protein YgaU
LSLLFTVLIQGCSYFSTKPENEKTAFQGANLSSTEYSAPVPVEIVDDIDSLTDQEHPGQLSNAKQSDEAKKGDSKQAQANDSKVDQTKLAQANSKQDESQQKFFQKAKSGDAKSSKAGSDQGTSTKAESAQNDRDPSGKADPNSAATVDEEKKDLLSSNADSQTESKLPTKSGRKSGPRGKGHGHSQKYVVKRGDTLMKISFAKYGNVYRWREIYNANKPLIPDYNHLRWGTVLTIYGVEYVVIEKNGTPYLIKRSDTLVKLSKKFYGTPAKWKQIWQNNSHLIQNPNHLFAGFTIYYLNSEGLHEVKQTKKNTGSLNRRVPAQQ